MGRPSKYDAKYCQMLVEHMSEGLSFESFAAVIDVDRDTLYNWANTHQEFFDAKSQGFDKARIFWEKVARDGACGKNKNVNATLTIFNLKNRFPNEWKDRQEVTNITKEETEDLIKEAKELLGKVE